ncbi:MAG: ABC transporter substrate-binding protein [Thermoanaerobacter sp.]|nr:ABC transporter substrate-binding protein [Thermoanaerobacter sp.]
MRDRTLKLIEAAAEVLAEHRPMTLRQVYYQLVSRHVIQNNRNEYQRLSNALVKARQEGIIPWDWIEDRTRKPRQPAMWQDLQDFLETVRQAYRKDIWASQGRYLEVWLEKEALAGIFEPITEEYGVTLVVGRGYNSWTALYEAAERIRAMARPTILLYFGDFDPSGEDICRALAEGLGFFGVFPEVVKVALTKEDVTAHNLPPDFTKATDSRRKAFVQRYGDMAVELDALPLPVLREKIREAIEANLDLTALGEIRREEQKDLELLKAVLP